jgi:hypothetical protein
VWKFSRCLLRTLALDLSLTKVKEPKDSESDELVEDSGHDPVSPEVIPAGYRPITRFGLARRPARLAHPIGRPTRTKKDVARSSAVMDSRYERSSETVSGV